MKRTEEIQNFSSQESVWISNINVLGQNVWEKEMPLTGTLTDLISVADGYILVGNYMVFRDHTGKEYRTKVGANECSPFIEKLNEQGNIVHAKPFETPSSVFVQRVIKISDNSINLLGYGEKLDVALNKTFPEADKSVHIMTIKQAQWVCSSY